MKTTCVLAACAAVVAAQNSSLPECGATCISNMQAVMQAAPYGCPNEAACFCCKADFGYGIRDCTEQYCGSDSAAVSSAITYAASYCASALPSTATSICTSYSGASIVGTATGSAASATGSAGAGSGSGSGPAGYIIPVAGGTSGYSIASTTLTAGGPDITVSATDYSVLPSNEGIRATASGLTTTIVPSQLGAGASSAGGAGGAGASGASGASGAGHTSAATSSGTGAAGGASSSAPAAGGSGAAASSTTAGGAGAMITAAPLLAGAAALAAFAF